MNYWGAFLVMLAASSGVQTPTKTERCPGTTKRLVAARTFETLVGATGCLTPSAEVFLVLYRARDIDGFRTLAKAPAAGAQLYALCGLKHLRVDAEASVLRQKLATSQEKTAIHFGCTGSGPMTPVSELVVAKKGQPVSEFDSVCDYLVEQGLEPSRRACDSDSARPTCQ